MFRNRTRSFAAIASGIALTAALTGCGSSDEEKSADKTGSSSSSPSASPTDAGDDALDAGAFITKVTEAMKKAKTAHLVLDLGSSMQADADISYEGDATAMQMKMTTGGQNIQMIVVDGAMYMQQAPGGKWIKIDKSDPAMGAMLGQLDNLGPASSLDAIKKGLTKVTKAGSEDIDGESFDKYELTINTAAVKDTLGAAAGDGELPETVTYTMYVGEDDLLRRINMEIGGQKIVMNATDWGKSVKIQAPPADQIMAR